MTKEKRQNQKQQTTIIGYATIAAAVVFGVYLPLGRIFGLIQMHQINPPLCLAFYAGGNCAATLNDKQIFKKINLIIKTGKKW